MLSCYRAPSPISHPGSPPPAFQQEGMSPVGMTPYQSAPIAYQQQHQMEYPPGSPPPAFQQEGITPVGMTTYQSAPIAYQQQHQMQYPPQQAPFNQQPGYPQQPNQQQAFHPQMAPQ